MQLFRKNPNLEKKVRFYIDNNTMKQGQGINGIRMYSSDKLLEREFEEPILICSMQNADEIIKQIEGMHISNKCYVI